jgi:hypothetical protein
MNASSRGVRVHRLKFRHACENRGKVKLPEIEYEAGYEIRKTDCSDHISFKGHLIKTSKAVIKQAVAITPDQEQDGQYPVHFFIR